MCKLSNYADLSAAFTQPRRVLVTTASGHTHEFFYDPASVPAADADLRATLLSKTLRPPADNKNRKRRERTPL